MINKVLTITQLAQLLGVSRVAIFKRIKKGELKAERIGRMWVIPLAEYESILGERLTPRQKKTIDLAVTKVVKDYGQTLKMLADE